MGSTEARVLPEIPREGLGQFGELLSAPDLAAVPVSAVEVAVEHHLHVLRDVYLERLEPRPGLRLRRLRRLLCSRLLCGLGERRGRRR